MTPPLCDSEGAEENANECLGKALEVDGTNIDALQNLANLRIMRARDDEARDLLR